jgi:hypothetical protein
VSRETLFDITTRVCPFDGFDSSTATPTATRKSPANDAVGKAESHSVGNSQVLDEGADIKYFLAAASITSITTARHVRKTVEWVTYHYIMGVEHFWIFCHEV